VKTKAGEVRVAKTEEKREKGRGVQKTKREEEERKEENTKKNNNGSKEDGRKIEDLGQRRESSKV